MAGEQVVPPGTQGAQGAQGGTVPPAAPPSPPTAKTPEQVAAELLAEEQARAAAAEAERLRLREVEELTMRRAAEEQARAAAPAELRFNDSLFLNPDGAEISTITMMAGELKIGSIVYRPTSAAPYREADAKLKPGTELDRAGVVVSIEHGEPGCAAQVGIMHRFALNHAGREWLGRVAAKWLFRVDETAPGVWLVETNRATE